MYENNKIPTFEEIEIEINKRGFEFNYCLNTLSKIQIQLRRVNH